MNPKSEIFVKSAKLLDVSILLILVFILIDFLAYDYKYIHLEKSVIPIPYEMKRYFEFLPWLLFIVLVIDLYCKYLIVGKNWDKFFRKYWLDILLTLLIPIMYPLKIIKASLKSYKLIKTTKYSFKLGQKLKKFKFF